MTIAPMQQFVDEVNNGPTNNERANMLDPQALRTNVDVLFLQVCHVDLVREAKLSVAR